MSSWQGGQAPTRQCLTGCLTGCLTISKCVLRQSWSSWHGGHTRQPRMPSQLMGPVGVGQESNAAPASAVDWCRTSPVAQLGCQPVYHTRGGYATPISSPGACAGDPPHPSVGLTWKGGDSPVAALEPPSLMELQQDSWEQLMGESWSSLSRLACRFPSLLAPPGEGIGLDLTGGANPSPQQVRLLILYIPGVSGNMLYTVTVCALCSNILQIRREGTRIRS